MRRRSTVVTLGMTAVAAAALTGCSTGPTAAPLVADAPSATVDTTIDEGSTVTTEATPGDGAVVAGDGDGDADDTVVPDDAGDEAVEYAAVCVDESGEQRVDDASCEGLDPEEQRVHGGHGGAFLWYFLRAGSAFPAVGSRVRGGSYTPPSRPYAVGGLPATKGTLSAATRSSVSKGGFGGSARSGTVGG